MSETFSIEKDLEVQNIVGSGDLTKEIKVDVFAEGLKEKYGYNHYKSRDKSKEASDSEKEGGYTWISGGAQPGLYYEVSGDDGPQVTFHESGSYIVRADSEKELRETNDKVIQEVKELGVVEQDKDMDDFGFCVQNVVALAKLGQDIKLRMLKMSLDKKDVQYVPEVFPALEYSTDDSSYPCSFLVYGNGKVIIAGASSVDEVEKAMKKFYKEIDEAYLSAAEY
jgi:transcription initiation factor TFIID TATA-box-binding protein